MSAEQDIFSLWQGNNMIWSGTWTDWEQYKNTPKGQQSLQFIKTGNYKWAKGKQPTLPKRRANHVEMTATQQIIIRQHNKH